MKFIERVEIVDEYETWLNLQNKKNDFKLNNSPLTFLVFLETKGLLIDISKKRGIFE